MAAQNWAALDDSEYNSDPVQTPRTPRQEEIVEHLKQSGALREESWRPTWIQAHGLMMIATLVYATWNVVNTSMGKEGTSPLGFVLYRQLGSSLLLLLIQLFLTRREGVSFVPPEVSELWQRHLALGAIMTGFQVLIMVGASLTSAATVGVFQCLEPSVAAMLGFVLGMEDRALIKRRVLCAGTAGIGVAIIMVGRFTAKSDTDVGVSNSTVSNSTDSEGNKEEDSPELFGYLIGCAILFFEGGMVACYYLVQTKLLAAPINADPLRVTTWAYTFATPITLVVVIFNICVVNIDTHLTSFSVLFGMLANDGGSGLAPRWGILYAIFFASILGYWLWGVANKTLEASELILYQAVQLPVTATIAVFLLGESIGFTMLIGAVFVFGALVLKSPTFVKIKCIDPPPSQDGEAVEELELVETADPDDDDDGGTTKIHA